MTVLYHMYARVLLVCVAMHVSVYYIRICIINTHYMSRSSECTHAPIPHHPLRTPWDEILKSSRDARTTHGDDDARASADERRHGVLEVSILRARVRAVRAELRVDDQEEDGDDAEGGGEFKSETDAGWEGTRERETTVGSEREGWENVETQQWTTVGGREDAGGEDAGGEGWRDADAGTGVGERDDDDDDDDDDGGGSREEEGESE